MPGGVKEAVEPMEGLWGALLFNAGKVLGLLHVQEEDAKTSK